MCTTETIGEKYTKGQDFYCKECVVAVWQHDVHGSVTRASDESCITNISSIIELRSLTSKSIRRKRKMTGNMGRWRGRGMTSTLMCCLNTVVSNLSRRSDGEWRFYLWHPVWHEVQSSRQIISLANVAKKSQARPEFQLVSFIPRIKAADPSWVFLFLAPTHFWMVPVGAGHPRPGSGSSTLHPPS